MKVVNINKILVTGRLYKEFGEIIKDKLSFKDKEFVCLPDNEVDQRMLKWADAYVAFKPVDNFDFYDIKWVHSLGAGVDGFILNRSWKNDVLLTRTICSFGDKISEYCISYMLADAQKHNEFHKQQNLYQWQMQVPRMLSNENVLILGTGQIGQEIAKKLKVFGCRVFGVSSSGMAKLYFDEVAAINKVGALNIDWIINTLPHTKAAENIINWGFLSDFNGAGLINVGRGASLDEEALLRSIDEGNIRLAVLDVFKEEPLPTKSKLWGKQGVIITPHIAAITSPEEAVNCFIDTLGNIEQGQEKVLNSVDVKREY